MIDSSKSTAAGPAEQGVSLIEVLITLVVLSIGLLGMAGLQVLSKQANFEAYQRTLATHLVDSMIERIKANPTDAANYQTGSSGVNSPLGGATIKTEPTPACDNGNSCTNTQLRAHDLWAWEQMIDGAMVQDSNNNSVGGLFNPRGCIIHTPEAKKTNTGRVTVILTWGSQIETSDAIQSGEATCGGGKAGSDSNRRQVSVDTYLYDDSEST